MNLNTKKTPHFANKPIRTNFSLKYWRQIFIALGLLVSINAMALAAPTKADTIKMIVTLKADSAKAKTKIDSLQKAISASANKPVCQSSFLVSISIIGFICLAICGFLIYASNTCPKDCTYALGLPDGTVRALIALFTIVFYILISLAFSLFSKESAIATDVTKTLGTLVVAVSSFYFGSKTAEQGGKNATDNITNFVNKTRI